MLFIVCSPCTRVLFLLHKHVLHFNFPERIFHFPTDLPHFLRFDFKGYVLILTIEMCFQDRQATLVHLDQLDHLAHLDLLVQRVQLGPRDQTVMLELLEMLDQLGNQVSEETMEHQERQALLDFEETLDYPDRMDSLDLLVLLAHQVQEEMWVA